MWETRLHCAHLSIAGTRQVETPGVLLGRRSKRLLCAPLLSSPRSLADREKPLPSICGLGFWRKSQRRPVHFGDGGIVRDRACGSFQRFNEHRH